VKPLRREGPFSLGERGKPLRREGPFPLGERRRVLKAGSGPKEGGELSLLNTRFTVGPCSLLLSVAGLGGL